jgi:hypothetical protein
MVVSNSTCMVMRALITVLIICATLGQHRIHSVWLFFGLLLIPQPAHIGLEGLQVGSMGVSTCCIT